MNLFKKAFAKLGELSIVGVGALSAALCVLGYAGVVGALYVKDNFYDKKSASIAAATNTAKPDPKPEETPAKASAVSAMHNAAISQPAICPGDSENFYMVYSSNGVIEAEFLCANTTALNTAKGLLAINQYLSEKSGSRAILINFLPAR